MKTREEAIEYCLKLENTYKDYPFRDKNWTLLRHKKTGRSLLGFSKETHIFGSM